jgi:hypothetical protein
MPVGKYFEGHGSEVMASIRKAHPNWSESRVKSEFYATANARNGKPGQKVAVSKSKTRQRTRRHGSQRVDTSEG